MTTEEHDTLEAGTVDDGRLTPADIHDVRFSSGSMLHPGYSAAEVDRFLARTSGELNRLHAEKAELRDQVRALSVEFARYGVRAHAILPGWIETNMTANAVNTDGFQKKVLPRVPMRRWGTGDDFGGIAVYLMSSASAYHTGDTFVIDGGYSLF